MNPILVFSVAAASLLYLLIYSIWVNKARRDRLSMEHKRIRTIEIQSQTPIPPTESNSSPAISAQPSEEAQPQYISGNGLEVTSFSRIGGRRQQQDAVEVSVFTAGEAERAYAVLCDGMGGLQGGELASRLTVSRLHKGICGCSDASALCAAMCDGLDDADSEVAALCDENGDGIRAGTTAVAAVVENNVLYWSSVGDSRIYLLREEKLAKLTRDHNYYLELSQKVSEGTLSQEEAERNIKKEALISYVGIGGITLLDHNGAGSQILPGDLILLCSDGLYKALSDEEISIISQRFAGDIKSMAKELVSAAINIGGARQDNTTVAIIRIK